MRWRTMCVVAAIGFTTGALAESPSILLTLPQRDAVRSPLDPPTVAVSANGGHLAFTSYARIAPADTNERSDVYVLDRDSGRVTIETLAPNGRARDTDSFNPRITANGRHVVFEAAVNDSPPRVDVMLRDRWTDTTRPISVSARRGSANGWSSTPDISAEGHVIVFASAASNLVDDDANGAGQDVYIFDVGTGALRRMKVHADVSFAPRLSADGRFVSFTAAQRRRGRHGFSQVYVHDRMGSGLTM